MAYHSQIYPTSRPQTRNLLPGETPDSYECSRATECTCRPRSAPSSNGSTIANTVKSTWKFTCSLFNPLEFYSNDEMYNFDENPRKPLRPTLRSPRLLQTLPVEILDQILNDVVQSSTASTRICRCMHPGTDIKEMKGRYLRWKLADTKSIRETCSRWHTWASQEHFSQRAGVTIDLSNVMDLRHRFEESRKQRLEAQRQRRSSRSERIDEKGHESEYYEGDVESEDDSDAEEVQEMDDYGNVILRAPRKHKPRPRQKPGQSIGSLLSYFFLPEASVSTESMFSSFSHLPGNEWSIIHETFLEAFPFYKTGGVTIYLGSPLRISNLQNVHAMLSQCDVWSNHLLQNGGGMKFWDLTYAWREDTDMFERIMETLVLNKQRLLKYYDNPDREYWGIDEANWIIDPSRRPDMTRNNSVAQRTQQKYALSRRAHEFIVEERIATIKSDAKIVLDIIAEVKGSTSIQIPINLFALLPSSEWLPVLRSSLDHCQDVDFREFIYCNEKQFSLLVSQLSDAGVDHTRELPRDIWWNALSVTEQAVNWEVDFLMEKMWDDFHKSFATEYWRYPNTAIKNLALGGRGWQRFSSHNFSGGLLGRGHERRWLNADFLTGFLLGVPDDPKQSPYGMALRGLESFNLDQGAWASEISLGTCLASLGQSGSANTLRSLVYWPAIPQQSMSPLHPPQPHHCPLLAYFPNLCDVSLYSVCCPEIFKAFLPDDHALRTQCQSTPDENTATSATPVPPKPRYNTALHRKWRITVPRVLKSIVRGCRDHSQETTTFWSMGPSETDHEQGKAEFLLKTPSWGLTWTESSLQDLCASARAARDVLGPKWDLEITFEGMVALESSAYTAGVPSGFSGISGSRFSSFEGYRDLFPGRHNSTLEYKETIFYPVQEKPMVKVVARIMSVRDDGGESDELHDLEDDEDDGGGGGGGDEDGRRRMMRDDGIRVAWRLEEEFFDNDLDI